VRQPLVILRRSRKEEERGLLLLRRLQETERYLKDVSPLPPISGTLDTLAGAKWFSNLDVKNGYWQVDQHLDDKGKTAFSAV
jgi:hypothetical protein